MRKERDSPAPLRMEQGGEEKKKKPVSEREGGSPIFVEGGREKAISILLSSRGGK